MDIRSAYNDWSKNYDSNINKTRDLEAISLRETLQNLKFKSCLEIGCGTGKNTEWLVTKADKIVAVDFSERMLAVAKNKINSPKVEFIQADILEAWNFTSGRLFDLVTFSLVLEHIQELELIFQKVKEVTDDNAYVYIGELHPFKQYGGSKARFETETGLEIVTCFNHNISDFTQAAQNAGFHIVLLQEYFDENDRNSIPRILTLVLKKTKDTSFVK